MPKRKLSDSEISLQDEHVGDESDEVNPEENAPKRKRAAAAVIADESKCQSNKDNHQQEDLSPPRKKQVRFDGITLFYFKRSQGFSSIPTHGGSTIGMADRHHSVRHLSLQQHEKEVISERYGKASAAAVLVDGVEPVASCASASDASPLGEGEAEAEDSPPSSVEEDCGGDEEHENNEPCFASSNAFAEDGYFLQPLGSRQRKLLLKAAGVTDLGKDEREELKQIRKSREVCGCDCKDTCLPESCHCAINDIKCQVDRLSFPCACTKDTCSNPTGRVEFNPVRVRSHYLNTMMRLKLEERRLCGDEEVPSPSHIRFTNEDSYCENSSSDDTTTTYCGATAVFQKQLLQRQLSSGGYLSSSLPSAMQSALFPKFESVFGSGRGGSSYTLVSPQHPLPSSSSNACLPSSAPHAADNSVGVGGYTNHHHQTGYSNNVHHKSISAPAEDCWVNPSSSFESSPRNYFASSGQGYHHLLHASPAPPLHSAPNNGSTTTEGHYSSADNHRAGLKAVAQFCSSYDFAAYGHQGQQNAASHCVRQATDSSSLHCNIANNNINNSNNLIIGQNGGAFASSPVGVKGSTSKGDTNDYFHQLSSSYSYNDTTNSGTTNSSKALYAEQKTSAEEEKGASSQNSDANQQQTSSRQSEEQEFDLDRSEATSFSSYAFAEAVLATVAASPGADSADTSTDSGFEEGLLIAEPMVFASNVQRGTTSVGHWSLAEQVDGRLLRSSSVVVTDCSSLEPYPISSLYPHMQHTTKVSQFLEDASAATIAAAASATKSVVHSSYYQAFKDFPFDAVSDSASLSNSSSSGSTTGDDVLVLPVFSATGTDDRALELLSDGEDDNLDEIDPSGWRLRSSSFWEQRSRHVKAASCANNVQASSAGAVLPSCFGFDARSSGQEQLGTVLKKSICETALA